MRQVQLRSRHRVTGPLTTCVVKSRNESTCTRFTLERPRIRNQYILDRPFRLIAKIFTFERWRPLHILSRRQTPEESLGKLGPFQ